MRINFDDTEWTIEQFGSKSIQKITVEQLIRKFIDGNIENFELQLRYRKQPKEITVKVKNIDIDEGGASIEFATEQDADNFWNNLDDAIINIVKNNETT